MQLGSHRKQRNVAGLKCLPTAFEGKVLRVCARNTSLSILQTINYTFINFFLVPLSCLKRHLFSYSRKHFTYIPANATTKMWVWMSDLVYYAVAIPIPTRCCDLREEHGVGLTPSIIHQIYTHTHLIWSPSYFFIFNIQGNVIMTLI